MLLYSQMAHHGRGDVMVSYDQVTLDGAACADDCVPALLGHAGGDRVDVRFPATG